MNYSKYFKSGQEILLLNLTEETPKRTETITAYLLRCADDFFDLTLPYNIADSQDLPFDKGTNFCMLSDTLGLGVQLTGHLMEVVGRSVIRISPHSDLQVFGRRQFLRADVKVGVYCKRGGGNLKANKAQWNAAIKSLAAGTAIPPGFSPAKVELNLSAGGLAMTLSPPPVIAELCLILINLGDGNQPIITLCEVVWIEMGESGKQISGLRFVEIVKEDQERINNFVMDELKKHGQDVQWQSQRVEILEKMHF